MPSLPRRAPLPRRAENTWPDRVSATARATTSPRNDAAMLTETDEPIATVAAMCGFYDQPDFTRRFARLTNTTPAQFRAQGGGFGGTD